MTTLKFTHQTMPQSGKALKQELRKALDRTSPLDDFIEVIKDLSNFEHQYNLESGEFYVRFQQGDMGDSIDFLRWATRYEIYQEMKSDLEQVFDLLEQYALPMPA